MLYTNQYRNLTETFRNLAGFRLQCGVIMGLARMEELMVSARPHLKKTGRLFMIF